MHVQSDHGHDTPSTGGHDSDERVWLDLVARLQEPDDAFMDGPDDAGTPDGAAPAGGAEAPGAETAPGAGHAPGDGIRAKGVDDFDPLGVWGRQLSPAPHEPGFDNVPGGAGTPGPRDYEAEDLEGEFVPGEPPSLAGAEPAVVLSWIGAAGGPIFLVLAAIFWRGMPLVGVIGVILAFLAGTSYLIYRLPKNRDHDGGDGAVV
ncbi:hypothetical protein B5P43_28690 [Bacillus sp. SRB_336]|nr:hypothetical protein B5P43_28690 [Bacillus sp. SRB_336]